MQYVLLDANIIIYAFDAEDKTHPLHLKASKMMREFLSDDSVKLAITPLIRYEVLRGIKTISADEMQAILNDFEEFIVDEAIAVRGAKIFHRLPKKDDLNDLDKKNYKHNFDILHYVVKEKYDFEFSSEDSDIKKIESHVRSID